MGRFIYKPGAIYEVNEQFKEVWQDSGELELYKDDEARLMVFDDTKIPINRTKYLEISYEDMNNAITKLFTPKGINLSEDEYPVFGDIPVLHEYYNYLEDRLFGRYYFDFDKNEFIWDDKEHAITPIEEDMSELRNYLLFFISRLDYINSVLAYNFEHLNALYRKYYGCVNGTLLKRASELLKDNVKYWNTREKREDPENPDLNYREDNYWDTQIDIYHTNGEVNKYSILIDDIEESIDHRLFNMDKYLGENAFVDYEYVLKNNGKYDGKSYAWLIISLDEIKRVPNEDGTYIEYKSNYNTNVGVGQLIRISDIATNHPDGYLTLTGCKDKAELDNTGPRFTYVFSNAELVQYDSKLNGYIAKKKGKTHMFVACPYYHNIKSNVITINIV